MSLRALHVIVIIFSILLLFFFGVWAISNFQISKNTAILTLGIVSVLAGILLVPYLVWFIIKIRRSTVQ